MVAGGARHAGGRTTGFSCCRGRERLLLSEEVWLGAALGRANWPQTSRERAGGREALVLLQPCRCPECQWWSDPNMELLVKESQLQPREAKVGGEPRDSDFVTRRCSHFSMLWLPPWRLAESKCTTDVEVWKALNNAWRCESWFSPVFKVPYSVISRCDRKVKGMAFSRTAFCYLGLFSRTSMLQGRQTSPFCPSGR